MSIMRRFVNFDTLDLDKKVDFIWNKGEFLKERKHQGYRVLLFALDKNFVELWYHLEENKIDDIRVEKSSEILSLYVDDIELDF